MKNRFNMSWFLLGMLLVGGTGFSSYSQNHTTLKNMPEVRVKVNKKRSPDGRILQYDSTYYFSSGNLREIDSTWKFPMRPSFSEPDIFKKFDWSRPFEWHYKMLNEMVAPLEPPRKIYDKKPKKSVLPGEMVI